MTSSGPSRIPTSIWKRRGGSAWRPSAASPSRIPNVGLAAAHAAGTMAFMVPDILPPSPEARAKCLQVVPDLHAALKLLEAEL